LNLILQGVIAFVLIGIVVALAYWVDKRADYEDYE